MTQAATLSAATLPAPAHAGSGTILIRRLRFLAAMGVAGVIFYYFGWWVARPPDPLSAVALMTLDQGVIAMAELLGLAVVVSGLAVAICGANSAERGPLAVAVGLATLAARAEHMDKLVLYRLTSAPQGSAAADFAFPTWAFVAETWLWLALIGVGFVVGRWVESWFTPVQTPAPMRPATDAGADIRQSGGTVAISVAIAWILLSYFVAGYAYPIERGQIYFGVAFAFLAASLISHWLFQLRTRTWLLVVVGLVASAAYVYGGPPDEMLEAAAKFGFFIPLAPLARPLPIEYAALGAIGVLIERDVMELLAAMFGIGPAESDSASGAA
ncbi:MAG TPA: hypothetical protein VNT79_16035 [Phycisphaerae bacterium]|nr:hypothetical protein [Phycisphaerae bacterium]